MSALRRLPTVRAAGFLVVLTVAACGAVTTYDTAIMPRTGAGTPVMSDQGAIAAASYDLGDPSRTRGMPGEAARALAAVDYLAGALYSNPHWDGIPAETKLLMVQGRGEVRSLLQVPPGTPSQAVVNGLVAAGNALDGHNIPAAEAALSPGVFTLGPQRTIALLSNLPYLPKANVAAQKANVDTNLNCAFSPNCG